MIGDTRPRPSEPIWLRRAYPEQNLVVDMYEVGFDVERVRSESAVEPDMDWVHTDPAGHLHRFVTPPDEETAPAADWLPTLVKEHRHIDCDGSCEGITGGDCEGYSVPVWFCRECRAEVEPGTVPYAEARWPGLPVTEITRWKIVIKSQTELPEVIEGDLSIVQERSEDFTRIVREDVTPIETELHRTDVEIEMSGSGVQFSTTYVGEVLKPAPRRLPRL